MTKLPFLALLGFLLGVASPLHAQLRPDGATASFKGNLPPKPTADLSAEQQSALEHELVDVTTAFQAVKKHPRAADVDIFLKAVRYALEFHEWYDKKPEDGLKKAREELAEATRRIEALKQNKTPWLDGPGQKVLGFYSRIDDSPQPYGVEIPEGLKYGPGNNAVPMWIWLHGRGDTSTDLHFIASRLKAKRGQFQPANAIVIHPFGRYCNGWKSAGETDVMECKADATKRFNVDVNRIVLAGFSMGGAGAWHLGAHFADQWCCVHTGAGFVDVKRYTKLTPDKFPPWYEQKLWGEYDVPDYARNLLNVPLISYSGEIDPQRDSAEYMMEVLGKEGLHPQYLIGPGMPHKYHPDTLKELQALIEKEVEKGRDPWPHEVHVQTRTPFYGHQFWVSIISQQQMWEDARVDAKWQGDGTLVVTTKNVSRIALGDFPKDHSPKFCRVDGHDVGPLVTRSAAGESWLLENKNGAWVPDDSKGLSKGIWSSGTADEAFKRRFLVVLPDGTSPNAKVQSWADAESAHFLKRWRQLMRGDARVKKASEVSAASDRGESLILWGDPESNKVIAEVLPKLPLTWNEHEFSIAGSTHDASSQVPVLCYPHVFSDTWQSNHYIVLNTGLTFREAHDKTNSTQNPKLPDWAVLDLTQPPNAETAGKVVAADFFDEHWQAKPNPPPVDAK